MKCLPLWHDTLDLMPSYLLLRHPSANRVYAGEAAALTAAELEITAPFASGIGQAEVAEVMPTPWGATSWRRSHGSRRRSRCSSVLATCCGPSAFPRSISWTTTW